MMKRILLLLLFPLSLFSQEDTSGHDTWFYGAHLGCNITKFDQDSLSVETAFLPRIGFSADKMFDSDIMLMLSGAYSLKGANSLDPYYKYRYHYIDFSLSCHYWLLRNVKAGLGVQPSLLISSFLHTATEKYELPKGTLGTQIGVFADLQLSLQKNASLGLRYVYPFDNKGFNNLQVGINYYFDPAKIKESINRPKVEAYQNIRQLENGVLLVKLLTSANKIKAYEKMGAYDMADSVRKQQGFENHSIMDTFLRMFNFCPVYFFLSDDMDKVLKHEFDGIFLNQNMQKDPHIVMNSEIYYIADLGFYRNDYLVSKKEDLGIEEHLTVSDKEYFGFVIKNAKMEKLNYPFPYFHRLQRKEEGLTTRITIWMMNRQFHDFLKRSYIEYQDDPKKN